jgi:SAM-dependent methyltransferase
MKIKRMVVNLLCLFLPHKSLRHKLRKVAGIGGVNRNTGLIVRKYLSNLNGIEIGASSENPFWLEETGGYCNIDFKMNAWKKFNKSSQIINIVANGDDLPFKDNVVDYVFHSHVLEHFFDPIKAIKEQLRVIKNGGILLMIIPHKERTYDRNRKCVSVQELLDRNSGKIKITDYCYSPIGMRGGESPMIGDTHILCVSQKSPDGYIHFREDDHHHWSVWDTKSFLELCEELKLNVVEYLDKDDRYGNGFVIVIKK